MKRNNLYLFENLQLYIVFCIKYQMRNCELFSTDKTTQL